MKTTAIKDSQDSHVPAGAMPAPADKALAHASTGTSAATTDPPPHSDAPAAPADGSLHASQSEPPVSTPPVHRSRKWFLLPGIVAALGVAGYFLVPWVGTALNTVSTDDAYVNGHVTFVAPRVPGQVMKVLVDDNQRVKKGDLLVQLDKEPYEVVVALKRDAVRVAESRLAAAESKARGLAAQLSALRWKLQNASEQVDAQIAQLRSQVAALRSAEATLDRAQADYKRAQGLLERGSIPRQQFDRQEQEYRVAVATVTQAQEVVAQVRVALGLPPRPEKGKELSDVPPELNQTFSAVRAALGECMLTAVQLGLPLKSTDLTPNKAMEEFRKLDKKGDGDIDQVLQDLVPKVPFVLEAKIRTGAGAARPAAGRTEPPLLRHHERDRRRGGGPERQPRQ